MDAEVVDAGAGWFERSTPSGDVRVCFRRVAYAAFGADLLAICDASVPAGPIHLRVRHPPPLVAGDHIEVTVEPGRRWTPRPTDPAGLDRHRGLCRSLLGGVRSPFGAEVTTGVRAMVERGDLLAVARHIGGRGPGLTPAGDDVLAGILLADALGPGARGLAARIAAARAVATTDVAQAFLAWAARGQCIEPAHRLLDALGAGDAGAARRALRSLGEIGASSGLDLAFGLGLGLGAGRRRADVTAQPERGTLTTATSSPSASVFDT